MRLALAEVARGNDDGDSFEIIDTDPEYEEERNSKGDLEKENWTSNTTSKDGKCILIVRVEVDHTVDPKTATTTVTARENNPVPSQHLKWTETYVAVSPPYHNTAVDLRSLTSPTTLSAFQAMNLDLAKVGTVAPSDTESYVSRALVRLRQLHDFDGALSDLERAVALDTADNYAIRFLYGRMLAIKDRDAEALTILQDALSMAPRTERGNILAHIDRIAAGN